MPTRNGAESLPRHSACVERDVGSEAKGALAQRVVRVLIPLAFLGLAGCRSKPPAETTSPPPAPAAAPTAPAEVDAELRASDDRYASFPIPQGFIESNRTGTTIRYVGRGIDSERLRKYVADRLEPLAVRPFGPATTLYDGAKVRGAPDDGHRVRIFVVSTAEGATLEITDIAPVVLPSDTTDEARNAAAREAWTNQQN